MSKSILITTFGHTWTIIPELLEFCIPPEQSIFKNNLQHCSFYNELNSLGIKKIDELWVITTKHVTTQESITKVEEWAKKRNHEIILHFISSDGLSDLVTSEDCKLMGEIIFRVMLKAYEEKKSGNNIIVSLAGGRKTMSSDIQRASDIFGCDLLFHIADNGKANLLNNYDFTEIFKEQEANIVFPIIVRKKIKPNSIVLIPNEISTAQYLIEFNQNNKQENIHEWLLEEIEERLTQATALHFNFYSQRITSKNQSVFHGILQLPTVKLSKLEYEAPTLEWIKKLPKIDLHVHLGGFFTPAEMVRIAKANQKKLEYYIKNNIEFSEWLMEVSNAIIQRNEKYLLEYIINKNVLRNKIPSIPQPFNVIGFLCCFDNHITFLEELIYGDFLKDENNFRNIGYEKYEKLGDLQGTALLQTEESLVEACSIIKEYCYDHNVKYLELRCSPANYNLGGLSSDDVVSILYKNLYDYEKTIIRLIIIGTRHGSIQNLRNHLSLVLSDKYENFIVGFDIAGNESTKSPSELREELLQLLKNCKKLTIHAGENQPVVNIWQAVYELNADRIGHGLTLKSDENLMQKFRDRNIFIEMCPSSNLQIAYFNSSDLKYPLRDYFDFGLKVTINTDNPGISRTNITNEYFLACQIAYLKKLEMISIVRNSIQGSFLSKDEKKKLMLNIEEEVFKIVNGE